MTPTVDIPPLPVTETAAALLKGILDNMDHAVHQALRLVVNTDGDISFELDIARDGDYQVTYGEQPVLLIPGPLPQSLAGTILDVVQMPEGSNLTLSRQAPQRLTRSLDATIPPGQPST